MEFKTEEMQRLLYAAKVLESYTEGLQKYEVFYYGRGIIVHPDYRRLGIAVELVKVRYVFFKSYKLNILPQTDSQYVSILVFSIIL